MKFDIDSARKAGYSDDEIAEYLATQNNFDLGGAIQSGYTSSDIIDYLAKPVAASPVAATGQRDLVDNPLNPQPKNERGIIDRVTDFFKPAPSSVMEGYTPTPAQQQAEIDKRLELGVGPVSNEAVTKAQDVREGNASPESAFVNRVAKALDKKGAPTVTGEAMRLTERERAEAAAERDRERRISRARKEFAEANPNISSFAAGGASLTKGIINAPSAVADAFNQTFINPILSATGFDPIARTPTAFGTEYLAKGIEEYMPKVGKQEMGEAWENEQFAPWLMSKISANSPQIAMQLAAAFVPPLRAAILPTLGASAVGSSFAEGDDSRVALAKGSIEILSEMLPLKVFDALKMLPVPKQNAIFAIAGQRMLNAGVALTGNAVANAIEETVAQFGGNVLDKYFEGKDISLTDKLGEAAVIGGVTGKVMSLPQVAGNLAGTNEPQNQFARAFADDVANTDFTDAGVRAEASALLNPNTYDPTLIDPRETSRPGFADFTPPDSVTREAGLTPIVVPIPTGDNDVGTADVLTDGPAAGSQPAGDLPGASVGVAGSIDDGSVGNLVGGAAGVGLLDRQVGPLADGAGQPVTGVDVRQRASDTDLLSRIGQTLPQNNNANTEPVTIWTGRSGDGYATQEAAQAGLESRLKRDPDLRWEIEQMPSGKFRLAGYDTTQETVDGIEAAQAQQAAPQGQEQPAAPAVVTAPNGQPFSTKKVAGVYAQQQGITGATIVQSGNGWVIQPQETTDGQGTQAAGAAMAGQPAQADRGVQQDTAAGRTALPAFGQTGASALPGRAAQVGGVDAGAIQRDLITIQDTRLKKKKEVTKLEVVPADQSSNAGMAQKIASIFKAPIMFVRDTKGNATFGAVTLRGRLYLNVDGEAPAITMAMHEVGHNLPKDIRAKMVSAVMQTVTPEQRAKFLQQFDYSTDSKDKQDEELVMRVIEQDAQKPEFWQKLSERLGDGEFAKLAKEILATLDRLIAGFRKEDSSEFTTDIKRVREIVADAYAETLERQGETEQADSVRSSESRAEDKGRVGKVGTHVLNAVRGERETSDRTRLSADEKNQIKVAAKKMKVPVAEVEQMVRDHKAAHPVEDGWAPLVFTGAKVNEDTGKADLEYQTVPYEFSNTPDGKALKPGTAEYNAKVASMAQAMLREVRTVFQRAQAGDKAAKNIIAQSGWYKEMRTRLRQEFGGLGDLFADLLGATSPNTPVRTNWDNSVEALRLASSGEYDNLLPQWVAWVEGVDQIDTEFRAFFDGQLKAGLTKKAISKLPEYQELKARAAAIRDFPDELLPLKANGKKFGFNGLNVVRAMVDLWRVVKNADPDINRGGTAPKAINFSGNLIGFRARATIDVWAARMLQRLAGGLRIPSMAEGGVSGNALEDGTNTLQFGFGQDVFGTAAGLIRRDPELSEDPVLASINDDDLQALVWFIEKEVWTKGNWTSAAGEGGSFEFESDLAGIADRDAVKDLRKIADSSVASTAEQRDQARADIADAKQAMESMPAIADAQRVLDANADRVMASKAAAKGEKLTKDQQDQIKTENAAARAAQKKAKASKEYKALQSKVNKAKSVLKKPTLEESQARRAGAVEALGKMSRTVDRFVGGVSLQQGAEQGVEPTVVSDAEMADLADTVKEAVIAGDPGATVIGLKAIATEGRYGAPERALDLEAIVRDGFDARPMAAAVFQAAQDANQDAAFVARVLRPDEQFDPEMHRPGIEIYFRDMKQAEAAAKMMGAITEQRIGKSSDVGPSYFGISGYTVVVDGRPTAAAKAGKMGVPVGMRIIYMPEFEARYGADPRLDGTTEYNIGDIIQERADDLVAFADAILRKFDGVSFAGRFNYEVESRFAGEYQGAIDGYTNTATAAGDRSGRSTAWKGRSNRESIEAATGRLPVDGSQSGAELSGRDGSDAEVQASEGRRTVAERLAYQGYERADVPKVQAARKINGIVKKLDAGTLTPQEFELQVRLLAERMADVADTKAANRVIKTRERGADIVREKLIAARRRGEIDPETTEFALWALNINPAIAEGLGITVREQPQSQRGSAGDYNPASEIMRVFKGKANTGTAVHEILHHAERMMPADVQDGIRKEWSRQYTKALTKADAKQRAALEMMLPAMVGDAKAEKAVRSAFSDGTLDADAHYQFVNPSEFWAVNATDILKRRYKSGSWIGKAKVWLREMASKVKGILGMQSDAPVLKALNDVLNGDGKRLSKKMLTELALMPDIAAPDTAAFKRWFGNSKVVDAQGNPLVVYHGTPNVGFTEFGSGNGGAFFSDRFDIAASYAGRFNEVEFDEEGAYADEMQGVYDAYLSLKNPLVVDWEGNDWGNGPEGLKLDDWANRAKRQGHDGLIAENVVDTGWLSPGLVSDNGLGKVYVAFKPDEQIKSATGNSGAFDPENPDIRASEKRKPIVGQNFTLPMQPMRQTARIKLQDDALRMRRVIEAVKKQGGTVGEAQNFYDANTLMPGRIQSAVNDFRNDVVLPMIDKAVAADIELDELALYAYALHAPERNAYIATINKRFPDGGSGMTDADAAKIIADVAASGKQAEFDDLHKDLMSITATTRQLLVNEGLITQDEFDAMDGAYDNYVPLRGLENVDENTGAMRPGVGRGINVRGKETIRALGRKSRASDVIENALRDYQRAVQRVEKNDVGKVLLDFVLSNPDPDLWGVDVEKTNAGFDKTRGVVQYTKVVEKGDDTIGVKVGGKQVYIKLADPDLARALRQAWKDEVSGFERVTVAASGWFNSWMRNVLTRYNPLFAAINIARDSLWSGSTAALAELGFKGTGKYLANYGKALMASGRSELGATGTTSVFGNPVMDRYFKEFQAAGGITGGFYMKSLDDINADLRADMLRGGAKANTIREALKNNLWNQTPGMAAALRAAGVSNVKANQVASYMSASGTMKALEFIGSASENATRFALYMAARESGKTPVQAGLLAKNGTTNFNRKGEWGGALNNLYLFFNAGMQGTQQLGKVLKSKKVQGVMMGVAGTAMMAAFYGAAVGGDDDDGESYWDKIPDYEKQRNLIIMMPPGDALGTGMERVGNRGRYIKVPVQYGFNFFPNLGYMAADVIRNQQDPKRGRTPTKAALHMISTVFGSINPFGGAVDMTDGVQVLMAVAPTIADLPIQLVNERSGFGTPSAPEKMPFDNRPDSERMYTSQQNTVPSKIAKVLNELGGGNEGKAGNIMGVDTSVTPGTIKTLISATTGGLGNFVEKMFTTGLAVTGQDKDLKASSMPFISQFYGEVDEGANIRKAGERMREVKAVIEQIEQQVKLGIDPTIGNEEKRMFALADAQELYQESMSEMRKDELTIIKDTTMTEPEKKLIRQQLQIARDQLATEVNRAYLEMLKMDREGAFKE